MQDEDKSKEQLLCELRETREKLSAMEATEARLVAAEKALRESEELLRLLYEDVTLGYQSLDENGYFLEMNQAWLDTLGYNREEVIGRWFGDFLASGCQDHFRINFPKFKAASEIHGVEFEMLSAQWHKYVVVSFCVNAKEMCDKSTPPKGGTRNAAHQPLRYRAFRG